MSMLMLLKEKKTIDTLAKIRALIKKLEPELDKQAEQLSIAAALAGRYELSAEIIMEILMEEYKMLKERNTFFEFLKNEGLKEGLEEGKKRVNKNTSWKFSKNDLES